MGCGFMRFIGCKKKLLLHSIDEVISENLSLKKMHCFAIFFLGRVQLLNILRISIGFIQMIHFIFRM